MRIKLIFLLLLCLPLCVFSGGCIQQGTTKVNVTPVLRNSRLALTPEKLYVKFPEDGPDKKGNTVKKSGRDTLDAVREGLRDWPGEIVFADEAESVPAALAKAAGQGCRYVLNIKILEWEDTPSSTERDVDVADIILIVYRIETGDLVHSEQLQCSGTPTKIVNIGSYGPETCLTPTVEMWARNTFHY